MSFVRLVTLNIVFIAIVIKFWSMMYSFFLEDNIMIPAALSGHIEDTNYDISEVLNFHNLINDTLDKIRNSLFFKVFKVNMNSECNFWIQNMICNYRTCSVCQCDETEIPLPWKQDSENDELNKNIGEQFYRWVEKYNYSSSNWLVENENDSKHWVYVNLLKNPEAFTGYQGQHIWSAIYKENCFSDKLNQLCQEDKVLYKIISGLHSNINIHLSMYYLDINKNLSFWNVSMFYERVGNHSERINNMFYLFSLLSKALLKIEHYVQDYKIYTGNNIEDESTKQYIKKLYEIINSEKNCFSSNGNKTMNTENIASSKKLNQLKLRFRNISEIIDCVSCQKCKLHGKLQVYGLATMLKILFTEGENFKIKRNEMIAFINLIAKLARALKGFLEFNDIIKQQYYNSILCKGIMIFLLSLILLIINYLYVNYGFKNDYVNAKLNEFNKQKLIEMQNSNETKEEKDSK